MEIVPVELGSRSYSIYIEEHLLDRAGTLIREVQAGGTAAVITNTTIAPLYAERVVTSLAGAGISVSSIIVPDGEQYKNLDQLQSIYSGLLAAGHDRKSFLIALGGGVIGDMTGFAAATFMRGIPFIQIPTTLLSQVDSSVGGKTGVNLKEGKNLVGSFHQPRRVLIDPLVLQTLPERELKSGMAEVIKTAIIHDHGFFAYLEENAGSLTTASISHIVATCCSIKAGITAQDETEQGIRAFLNFGHTIGHAIELLSGYTTYTHGEAVAMGMAAMAHISCNLAYCSRAEVDKILHVLRQAGLPTRLPDFPADEYVSAILKDKKKSDDLIQMVFLKQTGSVFLRPVAARQIDEFLTNVLKQRTP